VSYAHAFRSPDNRVARCHVFSLAGPAPRHPPRRGPMWGLYQDTTSNACSTGGAASRRSRLALTVARWGKSVSSIFKGAWLPAGAARPRPIAQPSLGALFLSPMPAPALTAPTLTASDVTTVCARHALRSPTLLVSKSSPSGRCGHRGQRQSCATRLAYTVHRDPTTARRSLSTLGDRTTPRPGLSTTLRLGALSRSTFFTLRVSAPCQR